MSGPFKLKYKNSAFPFKEQETNAIVEAAGNAYTIPEGTSITAGFLEGIAGSISTKSLSGKDDKGNKSDKGDKKESKLGQWWKKAIAEKKASHQAWRASRKYK